MIHYKTITITFIPTQKLTKQPNYLQTR